MTTPLLIGIPSKGRLQEQAQNFLARAGLHIEQARGGRDYRGIIKSLENIEILYLSASDITRELGLGAIHFGISGLDLVVEQWGENTPKISSLQPLGFGYANLIVAVPESWVDVHTMMDIDDVATRFRITHGRRMRVATKYVNATRAFFDRHNIIDYLIVESGGATEAAPAAGNADIIVDITTTGSTLRANALKTIDDGLILASEAQLFMSQMATWNSAQKETASQLLRRLAAEREANLHTELRVEPPLMGDHDELLKCYQATSIRRRDETPRLTSVLVSKKHAAPLATALLEKGAERVVARDVASVFEREPALLQRFLTRLATEAS